MRIATHALSLAVVVVCALEVATTPLASAATLTVRVVGPDAEPIPEIAIYVEQVGVPWARAAEPQLATMAQVDREFSPRILVVEAGTRVAFPNRDTVAHHVYSFSKPNDFVLPLYKGDDADPVSFDHDGVAILGCNIHDHMVGYVVVVNSSVFGVTDNSGSVALEINDEATAFVVNAWGSHIKRDDLPLTQRVDAGNTMDVVFTLSDLPRAPQKPRSGSVQWDDY